MNHEPLHWKKWNNDYDGFFTFKDVKSAVEGLLEDIKNGESAMSEVLYCSKCKEIFGYYEDFYGDIKNPLCLNCLIKKWFEDVI